LLPLPNRSYCCCRKKRHRQHDAEAMKANAHPRAGAFMAQQHQAGLNVPAGLMVIGLPLGTVRHNNAEWTRFRLPDGREIGIASTDSNKIKDVGREFLLAEAKMGRVFTDKDTINFGGVTAAFLDPWNQDGTATPPWQYKQRDWTIALVTLCMSLIVYAVMRALGWIVNGFTARTGRDRLRQ
jgi:hypothetical protein